MTGGWSDKRVFITGHTGFIGGWLALTLARAGAHVHGYSLPPPTEPSFFVATGLASSLARDVRGNVLDAAAISAAMASAKPDFVFHLAAQPIVRRAYTEPAETIEVNLMGTVRVLDAIRASPGVSGAVMMTTDKVYANREWSWGYRENDRLGGSEPYSAGKACAELITEAYRKSYFAGGCRIATVRAGNVIGGGDWAQDRIIPDAVRAFSAGQVLSVRSPSSVRPWQHVLDVVSGLLLTAEHLLAGRPGADDAFNIAPPTEEQVSVGELIDGFTRTWGDGAGWRSEVAHGPKETTLLRLDASKARLEIGWTPRLAVRQSIARTCGWYRAFHDRADMMRTSLADIEEVLG